jgi:hypothetical protein
VGEPLKPLTIGELLDRSFSLYRRNFLLFVGIAALPNLLPIVFSLAITLFPQDASTWTAVVTLCFTFLVYLFATALVQGATVAAVSQIHLGEPASISGALGAIQPRLGSLVLTILHMGMRVLIGFFFLIVPGVLLAIRYALAVPVAVVEHRMGSDALARSADLSEGSRGRIFVIYLLLILLLVIGSLLWEVPATILLLVLTGSIDAATTAIGQIVIQFGSYVTQTVLGPIATIATAVMYFDQRVRKEAFDLEHMMQQLDRGTPQPSPVP